MNFIVKNKAFICEYCGCKNPPAKKTCRNHCRQCLYSKHVDKDFPGDRASTCHGAMKPITLSGSGENLQIIHSCQKCHKKIKNKLALDDNFSEIIKLSQNHRL